MGEVLSGSYFGPQPTHQVPERTVTRRSFGWKCGRLMLCGAHLTMMMYRPGFSGSPKTTACDRPLPRSTHLIWPGRWKVMILGSGSAAFTDPSHANIPTVSPNCNERRSAQVIDMVASLR